MQIRNPIQIALLVALSVAVSTVGAQTVTIVDTQLGGTFGGTVDSSMGDVVQGRFEAAGGEVVTLTVQALGGSSLVPVVTIREAGGTPLSGGVSRRIGWMGMGNITHTFTIPTAGFYLAEIGGQSGSGSFSARLSGTPFLSNQVTVAGTVTNSLTSAPVSGATVEVAGSSYATTDGSGGFTGQLAPGTYNFVVSASGFQTLNQAVTVASTPITNLALVLDPVVPVNISTGATGNMTPGGAVMVSANVLTAPGVTVNSISWSQVSGAPVSFPEGGLPTDITVILGSTGDYKDTLVEHLEEAPVTADQLPPNVPLPPGEFPGGLQDRLQVLGINPFALEEAGLVVLEVAVDTSAGVFTDEVEIHTPIPWKVAPGLRNVPILRPVLLQAKEHTGYSWMLAKPMGSGATLMDANTRHPYFTPDVPGMYELTLADVPSGSTTLEVHAGTWRGTIIDQDMDGRPVGDTACTFCHNGAFLEDNFSEWAQTGHAEIFTNNINTSPYWGTQCFACHTVGYDPEVGVVNGGIDDVSDYQDFLDEGLIGSGQDSNWSATLLGFPDTAQRANIQCENCHGPQDSFAHGFAGPAGEPRVDLSSDVCATCHGEPLRHARFQQWQLSGHANYELAIDEANSGSCSRCHTANGFLAWLPVLLDDDPNTDPEDSVAVTWTSDQAHPQTCATCHDPHASGTTTGVNTNATVRISGDTPPLAAGFQVTDVGRGAICMTCHNSRRGLRNDSVWDTLPVSEKARAPHGSAQTDMLVGQNAYFVPVDTPGSHKFIEDACVTCHMESTPPPAVLAYNLGGTNHTFFAGLDICADCHSDHLTSDVVTEPIENLMHVVEDMMEEGLFELIDSLVDSGYGIDLNGGRFITDTSLIAEIQFTETRGRQAMAVTFTDTTVVGPHRMTDIDVLDAGMNPIDLCDGATNLCTMSGGDCEDNSDCGLILYDFAEQDLMKAGWNLLLVHNDGSHGIHNPLFASNVLGAARDALAALEPAAPAAAAPPRVGRGAIGQDRLDTPGREERRNEARRER